jgi:hypothetical protein
MSVLAAQEATASRLHNRLQPAGYTTVYSQQAAQQTTVSTNTPVNIKTTQTIREVTKQQ